MSDESHDDAFVAARGSGEGSRTKTDGAKGEGGGSTKGKSTKSKSKNKKNKLDVGVPVESARNGSSNPAQVSDDRAQASGRSSTDSTLADSARSDRDPGDLGADRSDIDKRGRTDDVVEANAADVDVAAIVEVDAGELPPGVGASPASRQPTKRQAAWDWVRANLAASVLALVAIVLAVVLIFALISIGNNNSLENARTTALAASRVYAVDLGSYNYQSLDQDFGKVLANSTPSFRQSFSQSSNALKSTLVRYDATSVAKVVSAGLVSATTSRAVSLVFLDQTISNSTQKSPTTDRSQVEITLVSSGGRWLIDQVSLL
ncbi:MAG TPA: hypothetical protein VEJ87_01380 [Acidimicrobiales bacterium]|nr:hypothetical protein [Acidimicrobiales bacterium]